MYLCHITGCKCSGLNHKQVKAYEGGYTYYAAWYGQRYGDGSVCISLVPGQAERIAEESAAFDAEEMGDYCDTPAIISGNEFTHSAKDLFTAAELREHRHDLLAGKVIILHK